MMFGYCLELAIRSLKRSRGLIALLVAIGLLLARLAGSAGVAAEVEPRITS